uniref:CSON011757 protein n=1 Tax=Culicoides sonorensis TaxID=179676 RepID=A0A336KKZ3_CULSO
MTMTACYRNFEFQQISQGVAHSHQLVANHQKQPQKDFSVPLHVDCSVEYELPNQAKPPAGTRIEPLLMIHPCYFRKMESQRRSPFINNMPNQQSSHISTSNTISSNSIDSSSTTRNHRQLSSSRQHSQIVQSTPQHHNHLQNNNNIQLPSSTGTSSITSSRIRPSVHQQQLNLQQQIDEYVQRHIVQMSVPPSVTYSSMSNSRKNSQNNSQSSSSNNNNNSHFQVQQSQRSSSTWDPYTISNLGHHKSIQHQQQKLMQCNAKQASHISNTMIEAGGLICTGRWYDTIEKTSSMAAIPRDFQSGPECIPNIESNISNQTTNSYRNSVGKRDAMLSAGCNIYGSESTAAEITLATSLWKPEKVSIGREYQFEPNNNLHKNVLHSKSSSSINNNVVSSSIISNNQNNYNFNNHNSLSTHTSQDQRHLLSGKYKQYLRSQRMHPYSILPSMTTAGTAFPQLGQTPGMFQQVSCFNV